MDEDIPIIFLTAKTQTEDLVKEAVDGVLAALDKD